MPGASVMFGAWKTRWSGVAGGCLALLGKVYSG